MANTQNLDLVKPVGTDRALISVLNGNSDKIDAYAGTVNDNIAKLEVIVVTVTMTGTGASVTASATDSRIETDMVVLQSVLSNPAAQLSDITWSTQTAGTLSLTGTINGTTTVTCYLMKSR